jgi:hypothetical protein
MACNLAMSFLLWNDPAKISFNIITDHPEYIPSFLQDKIKVTYKTSDELGNGFLSKLQIGDIIENPESIFIDSDCLVYGDLNPLFDEFKDHDVSVFGYNRFNGVDVGFCKDIKSTIQTMGISYFPLICGSVYFARNNEKSKRTFAFAKSIVKDYDTIGLVRLRDQENEEPLMAIAMASFNQVPVEDSGKLKADRMFYEYLSSNVLKGKARLWSKTLPISEYSTLMSAEPLIVHYNGSHVDNFEYLSEVTRLIKTYKNRWNRSVTNLYVSLFIILPGKSKMLIKTLFRPLYRLAFGFRDVKLSNRL